MERADNLKGTHRDDPTAPLGAGDYTRSTAATHLLQGTAVNLPQRPSTKPIRASGASNKKHRGGIRFFLRPTLCGPKMARICRLGGTYPGGRGHVTSIQLGLVILPC